MSISRQNWSALSSLASQWTREDEEEVEREKRRRVKSTNPDSDDDDDSGPTPRAGSSNNGSSGSDSTSETTQGLSGMEQIQLDFVEMLRVRDEKRRMRHVETLRRQKEVEENEGACPGGGGPRVELLGDLDDEQGTVLPSVQAQTKPQTPPKTTSYSTTSRLTNRQHQNGESQSKDPDPKPSSNPARKFVSSVSISLDSSPMSPRSPTAPLSPREHWPSPCQSPSPKGAQSPVHNGHKQESSANGSSSNSNFEETTKPAFARQSSRTISFRMMRRKEEESAPLQRSSSVRMASKKFESNTDQNEDEEKASSFQRNSKQRVSSRTIQEKMERLAQASQKSETVRSPDVTQRTLFLLEEVSRKRGLFEKEQQPATPASPGVSRQEFRSFTSGMSDRINRWLNKNNQPGSGHSPTDLRNVDITGKRSLFETRAEDGVPQGSPGKINK